MKSKKNKTHGIIENAGVTLESKIVKTLEENYMPYAMSVIMSRAIPEIDGFKPSHRKLLYTMYKMGLLDSSRTKSANIVGQTMKLNPHGDSAIYDTMVRLSRGHEALLHPYIDSKGNFGKFYSRDMAYAASRYTEARLEKIASELFYDIDKDTVDFIDNYDNTMKEPSLLPTRFPSILVNANTGIAVGMASTICSFNLEEVCKATIKILKDPECDIKDVLIAPDFAGGGSIVFDPNTIYDIYNSGRGSFKIRARYEYDKQLNCIDIKEIPPTTSTESIIDKIVDLIKQGKIKEISDIRDETGIDGLKITIDLKRSVDPENFMKKLFKITPLEDSFTCNFNVLVKGTPKVMGVKEILNNWIDFRVSCVRRRIIFEKNKKSSKLHLLNGLEKILLDIDKAISIIRNTEEEIKVVPNLMLNFSIDEDQAEFIAEIKLRHLNKEYILKRISDRINLEKEIKELSDILKSENGVKSVIANELKEIYKTYSHPRKTMLIYKDEIEEYTENFEIKDYPVTLFLTKEGYFKKITPMSLKMNSKQKLKKDDDIIVTCEASNACDILFFTNKYQVYKTRANEFGDTKASLIGDFVPAILKMDDDEFIISMVATNDYKGYLFFFFENGRFAKVPLASYKTKTDRKKLVGAYCEKFKLVAIYYSQEEKEYCLETHLSKMMILDTKVFSEKTTRTTQGVIAMNLKKGDFINCVYEYNKKISNDEIFRPKKYPSRGSDKKGIIYSQLNFFEPPL